MKNITKSLAVTTIGMIIICCNPVYTSAGEPGFTYNQRIVQKIINASGPQTEMLSKEKAFIYLNSRDSITMEFFMTQAALLGMKEVQAGGIATEKASDARIKAFGQMMVEAHSKSNTELRSLATARKITLPMSKPQGGQRPDERMDSSPENLKDTSRNQNTGAEARNTAEVTTGNPVQGYTVTQEGNINTEVQRLKELSGAGFDKAYANMMINDHKNAIALFQAGSKSANADIKAYALKYLPVLKNHLSQIVLIEGK